MTLRRPEAEDFLDLAQQFRTRRFGDPDSPVALYIGMAPDGTDAADGPAKIAAQHEQIGGLLDVLRAAAVLRQSHAIAKDDSLGLHVDARYPFDLGPRQARDTQDVIPGRAAQVLAQRLEAKRMLIDEGEIQYGFSPRANGRFVRFENELHHPLERRDVPAHPDLAIFAGDWVELNVTISIGFCGAANRSSARSRNGFIATIERRASTPRAGGSSCAGCSYRILPNHKDCVRFVEILQQNGALADADALRQAHAGRLVTHVRVIGKVICAEAPHEDLVEKGGFVRTAPRGVEVRLVGVLQRPELRANHREGVLPADRLVMVGRTVVAHRLRQATLFLQPVVALLFQFADRVRRKKLPRYPSLGEFEGDGFAPFSQNSNELVCSGSGHAHPGLSKPSGWFIDSSVSEPFSTTLCSRSACATARSAPQPPAGLSYGSKTGPASGHWPGTAGLRTEEEGG